MSMPYVGVALEHNRAMNMEGKEIETAHPFCYGCHSEIVGNLSIMATQRYVFPFHEGCFFGYIEEFSRKAPAAIQGEAQGEENARIAH